MSSSDDDLESYITGAHVNDHGNDDAHDYVTEAHGGDTDGLGHGGFDPNLPTDPYCDVCGRALAPRYAGSEVSFVCHCGEVKPGRAADRLIASAAGLESVAGSQPVAGQLELYGTMVLMSAYDPAAEWVAMECPECRAAEMARTVVSENMIVFYTCKCGHVSR
jgi:predicted RNA-binding Zn-ribbon protein involved in translation (DUF1610 family)